jgi:transposase
LLVQALGQPLAKRLLRHQDELFVFVREGGVPADNNLAERSLRPLVVSRKISGGTRSPAGSQTRMTLTSLFQTWLAQGRNPLHECRRFLQSPFPQL